MRGVKWRCHGVLKETVLWGRAWMADSDERWTLMLLLLLLMSLLLNMISSLCLRSISEQRCEVRGGQKTVVVVEDCHGSDQQRQKGSLGA